MNKWVKVIIILTSAGTFLGGCLNNPEQAEVTQVVEVETPIVAENPTNESSQTSGLGVEVETPGVIENSTKELPQTVVPAVNSTSFPEPIVFPLPDRSGPRTQTSGTVPHVQIGVEPVEAVNDELFRRAFALSGVEDRPTIVSLPGARGMWLSDELTLAHPEVIVSGREFAHIHPDGSLHAPLPYERALEVAEKGWGERHPWADEREGWDGLVMLYTPQSLAELDITFQLIVESYNYVTGQNVHVSDFK
jgi:phospholipase/carboxylesterase